MRPTITDAEIERSRLDRLAELAEDGSGISADKFRPGSFGYHEALHTASIAVTFLDRELVNHSAVLHDPLAYRLAYRAFESAIALYQHLGAEHL